MTVINRFEMDELSWLLFLVLCLGLFILGFVFGHFIYVF